MRITQLRKAIEDGSGLATGYWKKEDFESQEGSTLFEPSMNQETADACYEKWQQAVAAARLFTQR